MVTLRKLQQFLQTMGSNRLKVIVIVCLCFVCFSIIFKSCSEDTAIVNKLELVNDTNDTLYIQYEKPPYGTYLHPYNDGTFFAYTNKFPPNSRAFIYNGTFNEETFEELLINFKGKISYTDSLTIYKKCCDSCSNIVIPDGRIHAVKLWIGPFQYMQDNNHNFYNKKCWLSRENPHNKKTTIYTFTITESDLQP